MPRQRGGASEALIEELKGIYDQGGDLNVFYDRFFRKRAEQNNIKNVIIEKESQFSVAPKTATVTNSVLVIDMQNDFMLYPCPVPGAKPYPECGNFSVTNGMNVVAPLNAWLTANMENFNKVIFSRDSHDPQHCSFASNNGIFPDHCQINSPGAQIHDAFLNYAKDTTGKVDVIFKGMDKDVDSFGASAYIAGDAHAASRQVGKCCSTKGGAGGPGCTSLTGGFYMNGADLSRKFSPKPFTDNWEWAGIVDATKYTPFNVTDLFNGQTEGEHNIYIVGLAGDWCVRDTAYNIAKLRRDGKIGNLTVNVYVVEDFVRYVFVPIPAIPGTDLQKIQSNDPSKSLAHYAFKIDLSNGAPKWFPLSRAEVDTLTEETRSLGNFMRARNPIKDYFRFTNDPLDILKNYSDAGVKLILSPNSSNNQNYTGKSSPFAPLLNRMTGGRRTRFRKSRRLRQTRRQGR